MRLLVTFIAAFSLTFHPFAAAAQDADRVLTHWEGQLRLTGEAREAVNVGRGVSYRNGELRIDTGRMGGRRDPVEASFNIQLYLGEDRVLRMVVDRSCTAALFPADPSTAWDAGGGQWLIDYAYTNQERRCVNADEFNKHNALWIFRTGGDRVRVRYEKSWEFSEPYRGAAEVSGETILQPVYRTVRRQSADASDGPGWIAYAAGGLAILAGAALLNNLNGGADTGNVATSPGDAGRGQACAAGYCRGPDGYCVDPATIGGRCEG